MSSTSSVASVAFRSGSSELECEPSHSAKSIRSAAPFLRSTGQTSRSTKTSAHSLQMDWVESTLLPGDSPARTSASPVRAPGSTEFDQGCGVKCSGSCASCDPLGYSLRTFLLSELAERTGCSATFRKQATPHGRSWWVLTTLALPTAESASGSWPTPSATDFKSEVMSQELVQTRQAQSTRGVRLTEFLHRKMLPTPNAGNDHWGGRLDEYGGSTNPFRGHEIGRLRLNPSWIEELMGYPIGYTDCGPSEILLSRRSRKSSGGQS